MAPTFKRFSGPREFFVGASASGESELKAPLSMMLRNSLGLSVPTRGCETGYST
jgi:hypothetical protein